MNDRNYFKLWANPGNGTPTTLCTTTTASSWKYNDLTPNVQYSFQVAATNAYGDSYRSNIFTTFTLAAAPVAGQNVSSTAAAGDVKLLGATVMFANPAGFGVGTHGGGGYAVSGYRWAWDENSTYLFNGGEPTWTTGTLTQTPSHTGSFYLHLQSINATGLPTPQTLDYGPLIIGSAPVILTPPISQTVNPGDSTSFSVVASGNPPCIYQWKKGENELSDGGAIAGGTSATMTLSGVQYGDAGLYSCVVSNAAGSTESLPARLAVNPTLTIVSAHGTPSPAVGTAGYTTGTLVTATVPPIVDEVAGESRWVCMGWTTQGAGTAAGSGNEVTIPMDGPTVLTWQWKKQVWLAVTVNPAAGGAVLLEDHATAAAGWYDLGQTVRVCAMAQAGYRIAFWTGDLCGSETVGSVLMDQPRSIAVQFQDVYNGISGWMNYR